MSSIYSKVHQIIPIIILAFLIFLTCASKLSDESKVTEMSFI